MRKGRDGEKKKNTRLAELGTFAHRLQRRTMGPKDGIKIPILSSDVRVVLIPSRNGIHTARIDPSKWRSAPLLISGSGIHTAGIDPL